MLAASATATDIAEAAAAVILAVAALGGGLLALIKWVMRPRQELAALRERDRQNQAMEALRAEQRQAMQALRAELKPDGGNSFRDIVDGQFSEIRLHLARQDSILADLTRGQADAKDVQEAKDEKS